MPHKTYETAYDRAEEPPPPNDPRGYRGSQPTPTIPRQAALLVTGSQQWPAGEQQHMQRYVHQVVGRAKQQAMRLIVNDSPGGVDQAVVAAASAQGVDTTVYGTGPQPRNPAVTNNPHCRYTRVMREQVEAVAPGDYRRTPRPGTAAERDHQMIDGADRVLLIWNGQSQPERGLYRYAVEQATPVDVVAQRAGRMQVIRSAGHEVAPDPPPVPEPPPEVEAAPEGQADTSPASPVYTLSYAGMDSAAVGELAGHLDATLVDIRYTGRSRKTGFSSRELAAQFGERYVHVPGFSNRHHNDRSQAPEVRDYAAGLAQLADIQHAGPLILMCGCTQTHHCHRERLAGQLAADGYDYRGEALAVTREADITPTVEAEADLSEAETRVDVINADLEADPGHHALLDAQRGGSIAQMELDSAFRQSCALSEVDPEQWRDELAQTLRFQALPLDAMVQVGVQPAEPTLTPPPYYDAARDMALWVGVVQDAAADTGTTCLLAVEQVHQPDAAQAYLTPCYRGELETALHNGQELIDALDTTRDLNRLLGVAEGMARANGLHHLWTTPDGHPLEDSVSDALARQLEDTQTGIDI